MRAIGFGRLSQVCVAAVATLGISNVSAAIVIDIGLIEQNNEGAIEHCDEDIEDKDFTAAFECGDELFETVFNAIDGVGGNVGDGGRFTRVPRADQDGPTEWASHTPRRATGPNAAACNTCHFQPFDDGAGPAGVNVIRDPLHSAKPGKFIQRNTPHVFGIGALQVLAEEMNEELVAIEAAAIAEACGFPRRNVNKDLVAKGVDFGRVEVRVSLFGSCPLRVTRVTKGLDGDLVVKPLQWKGNFPTVRSFNRDASNNELGMQPVETTGDDVDGDFDGVKNEFSIADQTALAIYLAAQPRPTSLVELNELRELLEALGPEGEEEANELGLPHLSAGEVAAIENGEAIFAAIGCADCHRPALAIDDPVFAEPSANASYRDAVFPAGQNPVARGVDPANPIHFDLTADQPDNVIEVDGVVVARLGSFEADAQGRAIVRLYGDLKRHDMGPSLAENIDETGSGASVWITKELWGLGSTGQWLHDGRATTLTEAIAEHGGEASFSRALAGLLSPADQADLGAFLTNLVLFKVEEEE